MFGIECYVSQHEGFNGFVKTSPEDFKVTEISQEGKLASLTGTNIDTSQQLGTTSSLNAHPSETPTSDDVKRTAFDGENENLSSSKIACTEQETCQQTSILDDPRKYLESVVNEQTFDEIENFASNEFKLISCQESNVESNAEGQISNPNTELPHPTYLNLGTFSSKESRTIIHKSVRALYPHLRTKLHKLQDKEGLEIHISGEPLIAKFRELHIPIARILEFFKFVEVKDHQQTFSFEGLKSKDERAQLHHLISDHYGAFLESKTFADGASSKDEQKIVVRYRQAKKKGRKDQIFTGFTLQKTNTETLSAIQQLAKLMGVHASDFSYAGIKDKKAVTIQEMAVKGVSIRRMQDISTQLPPWLMIGSIHSRNKPIRTAELWGNHFDLSLKNVRSKTELLKKKSGAVKDAGNQLASSIELCIKSIEESGFSNYFGEQRFGSSTLDPSKAFTFISPADVGCAILQRKYKEAVNLILSPDNGPCADPNDEANIAKRLYQLTGTSGQALIAMPTMKTRECFVLKGLNRHGTDEDGCIKALMNIPHNMRQMYVRSFCSLIWNQMTSWRMHRYGYNVVEGDFVSDGDSEAKVHTVTQDDITKGTYSTMDVMLPLPGNRIQYPSHTAGAEYKRRLAEAGLGECNFRVPALKLNIPGGYRKVIAQPRNMEWGWDAFQDDEEGGLDGGKEQLLSPSNPDANPSESISEGLNSDSMVTAGSPNLLEASERHVTLSPNEQDAVRDIAHEISAPQPQEGSSCTSKSYMVSNSATASTHGNALSKDTPQSKLGPTAAVSSTNHHNDICQSSSQTIDRLSSYNKQSIESSSSQQASYQGRTLNLSFNLPASSYATVFLRELMKS